MKTNTKLKGKNVTSETWESNRNYMNIETKRISFLKKGRKKEISHDRYVNPGTLTNVNVRR